MLPKNKKLFALVLIAYDVVYALLQFFIILFLETVINVKNEQVSLKTADIEQAVVHLAAENTVAWSLFYCCGL